MARTKKKKGFGWSFLFLIIVSIAGISGYLIAFGPNTGDFGDNEYLYVHTGADFNKVIADLQERKIILNINTFTMVANALKLPESVHAGRYRVRKGMSNYKIAKMLRSGIQDPIKLVINKLRTKQEFVRLLSTNLEADSSAIMEMLNNKEYLSQFDLDTNTAMALVIPDTYEFFWNTPADKALKKIHKNYTRFWNEARTQKARALGITTVQAVIVASIVEEETNKAGDKPKIASVYLNRIRIGMPLQADPTVKFAIGDFAIKRVTGAMLQTNSPYNTYMYPGLPPGPICTPSPVSLNAVLDAPKTTYLYFCAKADFSGYSSFASTFDEQIRNANAYRRALDARGIH